MMKYDPWGSIQEETGVLGTDYTYTGQRSESALGLMYYVARWYDPHIAHFTQADTIVPGAGNPAAWDRYGYVLNNPLKYTDPSGHWPVGDDVDISEIIDLFNNNGVDWLDEEVHDSLVEWGNNSECQTGCPDGFENCSLTFDQELSQEEIEFWLIWLHRQKHHNDIVEVLVNGVTIGVGGIVALFNAPAGVAIETGIAMPTSQFLDNMNDEFDDYVGYIESALEYAKDNGGSVWISAGNATPNEWGSSFFIQYADTEPLILHYPVPIYRVTNIPVGK